MTFLHKLSQRLARLRAPIAAALVLAACEKPLAVTAPGGQMTRLQISPSSLTLFPNQTTSLMAVGFTATGDTATGISVSWSPTGGTIVGTSTSGGKHYGNYQSASQPGGYTVTAQAGTVSAAALVTVTPVPVASVVVSPATASVLMGQTTQFAATPQDSTGTPLTGRVVTWASANAALATVTPTGLVTGVAAGSATITATSEGKSASATVTVTAVSVPVASVTVSPATASVPAGQTVPLTATPKDASGTPLSGRVVTWASSSVAAATVDGSGLVTGVAAGSTAITATSEGKSATAALTVTIPSVSGPWPNEPAGWTVVDDYGFSALNSAGWVNQYPGDVSAGYISVATDLAAPQSAPSVWAFLYPVGYTGSVAPATQDYTITSPGAALYVGFWWKSSNPWQGHPSGVNKMAFFWIGNTNVYISMYGAGSGPFSTKFCTQGFGPGDLYENAGSSSPLALGVWHRIELLMNSPTGSVKWWVDGKLVGSYTGIAYPGNFDRLELSPTWGGTGGTKTETDYYYFDHIHASRP